MAYEATSPKGKRVVWCRVNEKFNKESIKHDTKLDDYSRLISAGFNTGAITWVFDRCITSVSSMHPEGNKYALNIKQDCFDILPARIKKYSELTEYEKSSDYVLRNKHNLGKPVSYKDFILSFSYSSIDAKFVDKIPSELIVNNPETVKYTKQYKKGDTVKIKSKEWYNANKNRFGSVEIPPVFTEGMSKFCGRTFNISKVTSSGYYYLDGGEDYSFSSEFFEEDYTPEKEIKTESKHVFKIGDRVRLKKNPEAMDGVHVNPTMYKYFDYSTVYTISSIKNNSYSTYSRYTLNNCGSWVFIDPWLELVAEEVKPTLEYLGLKSFDFDEGFILKEGDIVTIKPIEWYKKYAVPNDINGLDGGLSFVSEMSYSCGKRYKILNAYVSCSTRYNLEGADYTYSNSCFSEVNGIPIEKVYESWLKEHKKLELTPKYKPGDKVKLPSKKPESYPGVGWANGPMDEHLGKIVTIKTARVGERLSDGSKYIVYAIEEDGGSWSWAESYFENDVSDYTTTTINDSGTIILGRVSDIDYETSGYYGKARGICLNPCSEIITEISDLKLIRKGKKLLNTTKNPKLIKEEEIPNYKIRTKK